MDCGPFLAIHTEQAIRTGKLSEGDVNGALANTLTVQMRLGMFDGARQPYGNLGPKDVCTFAHQQLALEAARQGIVLLQNRARSLPLSRNRHPTVAVIGPNSDVTVTMIGNYAGMVSSSSNYENLGIEFPRQVSTLDNSNKVSSYTFSFFFFFQELLVPTQHHYKEYQDMLGQFIK